MKAVVLAGGLGSRLRPFTEVIPKPLLPIGEKAILEIQIEHLKKYGFDEIYLATNYKSDHIESFFGDGSRFGVKIHISKEDMPLGTAGPLTLLKNTLTEPFLVMNGDILTLSNMKNLFHFAMGSEAWLTVAIKKEVLPFAFGNITFNGNFVIDIVEKPNFVLYILAGIYIMKPEIFNLIPENKYFGMDTLIKDMLRLRLPITKYELNEYWLDIGRLNDYEKAQNEYMIISENIENPDSQKR
jgi:NDP-sugar pyrophosphorylase family protein